MQKEVHFKRILISIVIASIVYFIPFGIEGQAHTMLFVMTLVAALWITEAAPLHATAFVAAFLLIILVNLKPSLVFAQFFDPVIVLLLGGFAIAVAMSKHSLDKYFAYKIIGHIGKTSKLIVLGLLATTTFLSMWISNSAAAAIIMPMALVILAKNKVKKGISNFGKACVLAVGYGATIGGIGTLVGSPPNLIAAKFLQDSGNTFGFYHWFIRGFPYMLILMIFTWLALIFLYKPEKDISKVISHKANLNSNQKKVLIIFIITVILWITESIHNIHSSVVAIIPIILLYFTGLLNSKDFSKIDWQTLILIGGGLALGISIHETNLDSIFASLLKNLTSGGNIFYLLLILAIFGVLLTSFISNTTAAAVYLPIVVALTSTFNSGAVNTVVVAAIGVSLDFIFPFGTPPTAIAFSTRYVSMKDIAKAGIIISLMGALLLALIGFSWQL